MKLIVQIPCFNEAKTLPEVLSRLPRALAGVDDGWKHWWWMTGPPTAPPRRLVDSA